MKGNLKCIAIGLQIFFTATPAAAASIGSIMSGATSDLSSAGQLGLIIAAIAGLGLTVKGFIGMAKGSRGGEGLGINLMERPPVDVKPFNVLYQLLRLEIPWRCSILVKGGGLSSQFIKSVASQILYFTSDQNKQFNNAYRQVRDANIKNEVDVTFQAIFTTWVNYNDYENPVKEVRRRSAQLSTAIQSWER